QHIGGGEHQSHRHWSEARSDRHAPARLRPTVPDPRDPVSQHARGSAHGRRRRHGASQAGGFPADQGADLEVGPGRGRAMANRAAKSWSLIQWFKVTAWRWTSGNTALAPPNAISDRVPNWIASVSRVSENFMLRAARRARCSTAPAPTSRRAAGP